MKLMFLYSIPLLSSFLLFSCESVTQITSENTDPDFKPRHIYNILICGNENSYYYSKQNIIRKELASGLKRHGISTFSSRDVFEKNFI